MELQNTEWKETWRDDYLRWICGFANAEGGVLHIGLDYEGNPSGLKDAPKLLEDLPNKVRDILGIAVEVNLRATNGHSVLEINVPAYPSPISFRGHYYQRIGSTNQELKGAALDRFLLRKLGRTWDGALLPGVTLDNLDASAIHRFRELAKISGRLNDQMLAEPDDVLLRKLKLTENSYLKQAGYIQRIGFA